MPGKSSGKKKATAELVELLPELDEEGIAFLLEQARIHRHNMEVERRAAEAEKEAASSASKKRSAPPKGSAGKGAAEGRSAGASDFRVERSDDGETYHLVSGGAWKLFTAAEMAAMVAIARGEGREEALARRLHAWLLRERRDALGDFSLGETPGPASIGLVRTLRKAFSGKKR